ncbi:MAG: 50S ribosomal protein L3 [Bacteroidetes bacterium]|nr:50S ribosomal protein L3 [Bacteroidota bacterium]MBU1677406.1 50S ribosomal protein L3 [Bacteroidota bacterium]MBU2508303.1 50S ribosomal protein L3 [Bacteroidota bacterium]
MPGLLGKKLGMTSIYSADGEIIPVTVIEAGPCNVVAVKSIKTDGYDALQLSFGSKKEKHTTKPVSGYFKKRELTLAAVLREFKNYSGSEYKVGDVINVEILTVGDKVKVSSKSKGKGFQGVVRRHGFSGVGGRTHGQSDRERAPGSIGQSSYPSRVLKGTKMAGRMGYSRFTVSGLKVVKILPEKNIVLVKGAIPGSVNTIVEINK